MALKKAATAQVAPKFESDTDTDTVTTTLPPTTAPAADASSGPVALVQPATKALAVSGDKFGNFFKRFENALPPLEFGTLPRLVASQGAVIAKHNGKDIDLGRKVHITLISFNDEFVISPGSDDDEARSLVRYSYDGKTIEGTGENVQEYLERLRSVENYPDAAAKRYVQLIGILEESDTPSDLVGDMVQISLSPNAVPSWNGHQLQKSVKINRGQASEDGADRLVVTAEKRSGGGRNWSVFTVTG